MADTNIKAVITADDRASGTLKKFGNNASGLGNKLKTGLKGAAIGAAAAGAALISFGVSSVKSFEESENSLAQLNAVLKSTKGVAGVTAKSAIDLANSLQEVTKFSDEEVLSAENLLLTFTKIGKDIFPQATKTVLDMSTALGQDTKASAIQLGKALQDPILGVTALRRVGVNFSESQRDVIKRLVETGQSARAQKMILAELKTEFGGSAIAAGQTFAGKLQILRNRFDEVKESIGQVIVNGLFRLQAAITSFTATDGFRAWIVKVKNAFVSFVNFIMIYYKAAFGVILNSWHIIKPALMELWSTIKTQLLPSLKELWRQVGPVLGPALKALGIIVGATVVVAIVLLAKALTLLVKWISFLINQLNKAIGVIRAVVSASVSFYSAIYSRMIGPIKTAMVWVGNLIIKFASLARAIGSAVAPVYNAITAPFRAAFNWIISQINNVKAAISSISSAASSVGDALNPLNAFKKLVGHATGTSFAAGGPVMVGEQGPEIVNLPRGSQVVPHNSVKGGGGSTIINISVPMMTGSASERRRVARMLIKDIQDIASMNGTTASNMLNSNYGLIA